ncbi:CoA-binding protein, partial [Streptomyces sp. NPDC055078]
MGTHPLAVPRAVSADARSALLAPRSVAVVGASNRPSNAGLSFVRALRAAHFPGRLLAVNRDGSDVEGALGAASLRELSEAPDLAVLALPAPLVPGAVQEAAEAGVRALHVFTGGFAELGGAGPPAAQDRLARLCDEAGIALIGPNCMGLYRPRAGLAFREDQPMLDGPVAVVSQSGGVAITAVHQLAARGLGVSTAISFGNGAQLGAGALAELLADAGEHSVLAVHVESANEPDLADRLG